LVPLPDVMCERRLYLPLVGAALSLSVLVSRDRRRARILLVLVVLVLAPAMILRARVWSDPDRLWSEAARRSPRKARPLINLGVIAAEKGDTARADDLFGRAIALEPGNAEALFNRGKLRLDRADYAGAIDDLKASTEADPTLVRPHINLGI